MTKRVLIPLLFILISCQDIEESNNEEFAQSKVELDESVEAITVQEFIQSESTLNDTFNLPLDTAKIIPLLEVKIKDQMYPPDQPHLA